MKQVQLELQRMNVPYDNIKLLRNKNGVIVTRISYHNQSYVFKYFEKEEFRREINNYKILTALHIPTIRIFDVSDKAILMEDINISEKYRLGCEHDSHDPEIAALIGKWYQLLHKKGYQYILTNQNYLYDENDLVTLDMLKGIKYKTNTEYLPIWKLLEENIEVILRELSQMKRTITYNDFYYTNLIVAKDHSSAFMYDYNLLGKGYAYADIRNVCSSLTDDTKQSFLASYGSYDHKEQLMDDVVSVLISLHMACQREVFPNWAKSMVAELSTSYPEHIKCLLSSL